MHCQTQQSAGAYIFPISQFYLTSPISHNKRNAIVDEKKIKFKTANPSIACLFRYLEKDKHLYNNDNNTSEYWHLVH